GHNETASRGVAAWPAGGREVRRIFVGTIDGRLIAIDAATGKAAEDFGKAGTVNLREDAGEGEIGETSAPTIVGDLVILGSALGDNQRVNYPPGLIRAYSVKTGALVWTWNPIPQDPADSAYDTWKGPRAHQTGGANAWATLSADVARDLVFVPTTCPSPDYYGGERLGKNMNANSLVALRASTGKLVWRFQVVHHDIWDFDIAAQPIVMELEKDGKKIPAVVVGTKMGFIYVLNRETGVSLFPIEERPVAASTIAGEEAWPTQPFPVLPKPLGLQGLSKADAWGLTPEDKAEAEKRIGGFRYEGPFTPPSFEGSIMAPGNVGGINWSGMCYNPKTGMLYTNINRVAAVIRMLPRDKVDEVERQDATVMRAETGRQVGTPYVMKRDYLFKADERGMVMQTKPPWGTLVAIDLHTGAQKWEVPLGHMLDLKRWPEARNWGSINFGGAIVTGGNLIFVAASRDNTFRAFDSRTGAVLWEQELPAGGHATPMTYSLDGKQYVVIAAGGHGRLKTRLGDYVVAYALPSKKN
ncbi:MAG TPA: PQQ-binding-like beta-propeller repeat protein, partial [Puia sp.]